MDEDGTPFGRYRLIELLGAAAWATCGGPLTPKPSEWSL